MAETAAYFEVILILFYKKSMTVIRQEMLAALRNMEVRHCITYQPCSKNKCIKNNR